MLEKAKEVTAIDGFIYLKYARWADDLIVLVDEHRKWNGLEQRVNKRLNEEFKKIDVTLNLEKTKVTDLNKKGSFCFFGFKFKRIKTKLGKTSIAQIPMMKAGTKSGRKLKAIFYQYRSQSINEIIVLINLILRGLVNYFRVGSSSRCLEDVKQWVEKKVRRHYYLADRFINFYMKLLGKRSARNLYAAFVVADDGNGVLKATIPLLNSTVSYYGLKESRDGSIYIACIDGLKGSGEATNSVFPKTIVQRNSLNYVPWERQKDYSCGFKAYLYRP